MTINPKKKKIKKEEEDQIRHYKTPQTTTEKNNEKFPVVEISPFSNRNKTKLTNSNNQQQTNPFVTLDYDHSAPYTSISTTYDHSTYSDFFQSNPDLDWVNEHRAQKGLPKLDNFQ